jgi:hypothetical protein
MSSSVVEATARAMAVEVTQDDLVVSLVDGRKIVVPLAWFPRLSMQRRPSATAGSCWVTEWAFTGTRSTRTSASPVCSAALPPPCRGTLT